MRKREGNRPDRRIASMDVTTNEVMERLKARLDYVGSGIHKLCPGDYGFVPSHNPRPTKSVCDALRSIPLDEAKALFESGIGLGMVSSFPENGVPKYIWAVDCDNEVYEAKTKPDTDGQYHGYRLGDDDRIMRRYVLDEWQRRCKIRS